MDFLFVEVISKPLWLWLMFLTIVITLMVFDLGVLHKDDHEIGVAESLKLSAFYIAIAIASATATEVATAATAEVATTTATEAATATAAAATEAAGALFLGTSLIDAELATAEVLAVEAVDGCRHFLGRAHGDEGEAARTTGDAIHWKEDVGHGAELGKEGLDVLLSGCEGQIAHIHFGVHD